MTVGELREKLEDLPADAPVALEAPGGFTRTPVRSCATMGLVRDIMRVAPEESQTVYRSPRDQERGRLTVVVW